MRFTEAFRYTATHFGLGAAVNLIAGPRLSCRMPIFRKSYNAALREFLRKGIADIIQKYKNVSLYRPESKMSGKVWSLWWDDSGDLPEVVDVCRQSLERNIGDNELVILNKNTVWEYITVPQYICERVERGEMSLSHLSDIIRLELLIRYGGTWVDSCLFIMKPIRIGEKLTMTRVHPNESHCEGKWSFGVISTPSHHKLMRFMLDCLLRYWERYDAVVDYLMFDSFMMIAYEEFEDVRAEIDLFMMTSPDLHKSRYTFNEIAKKDVFDALVEKNEWLSLTWRLNYKTHINGEETFYGMLRRKFDI